MLLNRKDTLIDDSMTIIHKKLIEYKHWLFLPEPKKAFVYKRLQLIAGAVPKGMTAQFATQRGVDLLKLLNSWKNAK